MTLGQEAEGCPARVAAVEAREAGLCKAKLDGLRQTHELIRASMLEENRLLLDRIEEGEAWHRSPAFLVSVGALGGVALVLAVIAVSKTPAVGL